MTKPALPTLTPTHWKVRVTKTDDTVPGPPFGLRREFYYLATYGEVGDTDEAVFEHWSVANDQVSRALRSGLETALIPCALVEL